jgi:hypothetical protein
LFTGYTELFDYALLRGDQVDHWPYLVYERGKIRVVEIDHHNHRVARTARVFCKGTVGNKFAFTILR